MVKIFASLFVIFAVAPAAWAQASQQKPRPVAPRKSEQSGSNFYIKGGNAPFKNQQRKLTDPLNANGGR